MPTTDLNDGSRNSRSCPGFCCGVEGQVQTRSGYEPKSTSVISIVEGELGRWPPCRPVSAGGRVASGAATTGGSWCGC